jgi:Ion transport protein
VGLGERVPSYAYGLARAGCDLTVLLMCGATVWETLARLHEGRSANPTSTDGKIDSVWDVVELIFTIFFTFEVLLKVVVYGWRAYWRDFTNRRAPAAAALCPLRSTAQLREHGSFGLGLWSCCQWLQPPLGEAGVHLRMRCNHCHSCIFCARAGSSLSSLSAAC